MMAQLSTTCKALPNSRLCPRQAQRVLQSTTASTTARLQRTRCCTRTDKSLYVRIGHGNDSCTRQHRSSTARRRPRRAAGCPRAGASRRPRQRRSRRRGAPAAHVHRAATDGASHKHLSQAGGDAHAVGLAIPATRAAGAVSTTSWQRPVARRRRRGAASPPPHRFTWAKGQPQAPAELARPGACDLPPLHSNARAKRCLSVDPRGLSRLHKSLGGASLHPRAASRSTAPLVQAAAAA